MEEKKYVRPTWDEYFMEVANTIAKRATCDRGRSGCVIARNKQILVTGYVVRLSDCRIVMKLDTCSNR